MLDQAAKSRKVHLGHILENVAVNGALTIALTALVRNHICWKILALNLVEQLTHEPKLKRLNPATLAPEAVFLVAFDPSMNEL